MTTLTEKIAEALFVADGPRGEEDWARAAWADMSFPADDVTEEAFDYLTRAKAVLAVVRAHFTSDEAVEALARNIACLEPGEDWPTNEELGGHWGTGTRDDEYKDASRDEAREYIDTLLTAAMEAGQ